MFNSRKPALLLCAGMIAASGSLARAAEPGFYGYGNQPTPAQITGWNIDVRGDDGVGLPPGKGTVQRGSEVYAEQCAACHGIFGEGEGRFPKLVGGAGTLTHDRPELTVGSYWPYATTGFDFSRRSMPWTQPRSLTDQEVYALTAYLLAGNKLIGDDDERNATTLPKVKMPNRDNFVIRFPDRI